MASTDTHSPHMATQALLRDALWSALATQDYAAISMDLLADEQGIDRVTARLVAGDKMALVLAQCEALDLAILTQLRDDLEDAADELMHDKLLEALMQRFEAMAPHRAQIANLHQASLRDPILGLHLLAQLRQTADHILRLCGDDEESWQRMLRVKGLVGVMLRLRGTWQKDNTDDLAPTMKQIDKWLKEAASLAASLRLVPDAPTAEGTSTDRPAEDA